ncbi:MAG: methyltransferase domain-containing protein, partial [Pseudomonadota bacterium]
MSSTMDFDDATSRMVDQIYASPDVAATRQAVYRAIAPRAGEHFLDLGSGPGYLAVDLARSAGPAGSCTGVDLSATMIRLAGEKATGID